MKEYEETKENQFSEIEITCTGAASIPFGVPVQWTSLRFGMDD
jgi:hypothetical protein